ncbi:hypothetical protein N7457_004151 [Penicillium paradoxum]|uniref:uncharacterized protein n=1 Tax=Penicillium paradoxum TaxID=176176 RepID=UPI002547AA68|nr:uncharacterized protein N7457_004151 [Penicillium paradoxum]KAJ5782377.1 hypothetical protein N7457_004151 [Penicillium paradoxum]
MEDNILRCVICPGQPHFSDVSHLLTHTASKAHLANHFKLQLRSEDPRVAEILKQYGDWFEANGFAKQLTTRMVNKENRKKKQLGEASMSNATLATGDRAPNVEREVSNTSAATLIPEFLDPRLAGSYNGNQQKDTVLMPTTPDRLPIVNSTERSWTGPILRSMRSANGRSSNPEQLANIPGLDDNHRPLALPVTPIQPQRKLDTEDIVWASGQDSPDPFDNSTGHPESSGDVEMDKIRAEEMARLKGVLWPGMDIFDSATPKTRRKRNQKKDGTVLKQMEITSLCVEPNEQVFSYSGTLLKEREITGNVEEYSPLRGETPVPKRRMTRSQGNRLARADPNVPRAMDRRRQRTAARKGRKNARDRTAKEEPTPPRRSHRATDRTHSYLEDDDDLSLTVSAFGNQSRGGLGVFVDQEHGMQRMYQEPIMGFTGQYETLTPTRLILNGKTDTSGTQFPGNGHIAIAKENIQPILNSQGRIGPHAWHSPIAKRTAPGSFDHGSPYNFEPIGPHNSQDKVWYPFNPLQAPLSQPVDINQYNKEPAAAQNSWFSVNHAAPSEETIDEDDNMLSSYYLTGDAK